MSIQIPFARPDRYIVCPTCLKGEHRVDHLLAGTKTSWYCNNVECGRRFHLEVLKDGRVVTEPEDERTIPTVVTLESKGPVRIEVQGFVIVKDGQEPDFSHDEYHYNEHTCPVNYLGVEEVIDPTTGDEDPHGIFQYVKTEVWKEDGGRQ